MGKPILYMLVGAPGSGKSTWAHNFAQNLQYVSRDEIRFGLLKEGEDYFSHEEEVFENFATTIQSSLMNGNNVIADATHLNMASRKKLTNYIDKNFKDYNIVYIIFMASADVCIKHNANRTGRERVPDDVIRRMRAYMTVPLGEDKREIGSMNIIGEVV